MKNNMIERYIKETGALIQCPAAEKKAFLSRLREEIGELPQEEIGSVEALYERFGAPQELAQSLMSDGADLEFIKKRTRLRTGILAAVAAVLLIIAAAVVIELIDNHRQSSGYGKEYVVEYYSEPLTGGETER